MSSGTLRSLLSLAIAGLLAAGCGGKSEPASSPEAPAPVADAPPAPEPAPAEPSAARAELEAACACVDATVDMPDAANKASKLAECADAAINDPELQAWWESLGSEPSAEAKAASLRAEMKRVGLEQCKLENVWTGIPPEDA